MKNLVVSILIILIPGSAFSQKYYKTSGGELIFSRTINSEPLDHSSAGTRISAFLHINQYYHYNFGKVLGGFTGYSVSNIGFIYQNGDTTFKRRAYTIGVPVGIKVGNLNNDKYLFFGGEVELPFHYKQKRIVEDQKNKYTSFFDNRTNLIFPSVFAGIQLPGGLCLKFRVMLSDFLNKDFKGTDFGLKTDYKGTNTKLYLLSISFNLKETKIKNLVRNQNERYACLEI